ncbi:MAG: hypothetical protein MUF64_24720 [Polyangiaceae bacterium]|jgi:hypothetical protein|nr:hypothetical protein [Polyangiaceae bacterium]
MNLLRHLPPLLLLAGTSCVPEVEDLEVGATIDEATLTVEKSAFGSAADPQGTPQGTFRLTLSLGEFASGGSDVRVEQFALVNAETQEAYLSPVLLAASDPVQFRVEVNSSKQHRYTLAYDKPVKVGGLCGAKQVQFTGTIFDGARGKTTAVKSQPIAVSCP